MEKDGIETPTAYYSCQLKGAEIRYSVTEWEALAVIAAITHFMPLHYGRHFVVVTDHKPLTSRLTSIVLNKGLQG